MKRRAALAAMGPLVLLILHFALARTRFGRLVRMHSNEMQDITLADVEGGEGAEVTLTFPFAQKNLKGNEDEQKRIADRV